jgi:hypothetical protein
MKRSSVIRPQVLVTLAAAVVVFVSGCASGGFLGGGWKPLFNGRDLSGWVRKGGNANYRVDGAEIVGSPVPGTANTFLCTERSYTNFILEMEFKPMLNLNSGVQVRSEVFDTLTVTNINGKLYKFPPNRVHGYQIEIDPSPRAWTGGLYDEARRGWLQTLETNQPARLAFKAAQWNHLRIECRGDSIRSWLNGVAATDFHDSMTPSGLIGLQVHAVKTNLAGLEVRWRNVRLQELP